MSRVRAESGARQDSPVPAASQTDIAERRKLSTRYSRGKEIGKGAFATVYRGTDKQTGKAVAIKQVRRKDVRRPELLLREIDILREISSKHPSINTLLDLFDDGSSLFLVLDFVSGGELFDLIVEVGNFDETTEAHSIMYQLTSAVFFLHQHNVVHRDLKPENILTERTPSGQIKVQIVDFGLSRFAEDGTAMATFCGSPEYVAPEILEAKPYDPRVDIWSLGVIAYIVLTGYLPFFDKQQHVMFKRIRDIDWDWEGCPPLSDACRDFVGHLLVARDRRYSAEQAFNHPWIQSTVADESLPSPPLDGIVTPGIASPKKERARIGSKSTDLIAVVRSKSLE